MADQHRDRDRSWAQDEDESSPSLKTNPLIYHSTLFYFRAELCQRLSEAICSEGVKVNQVQRFYFFDSGQCPKTAGSVAGHRLVCRSASLCCSTHVGHKRTVLAEMWDVQWSLWRQERDGWGGEFNQSWPSARSLVTPKVLFPCAISPDRGSVARMANLLQSLISCTVTCTF